LRGTLCDCAGTVGGTVANISSEVRNGGTGRSDRLSVDSEQLDLLINHLVSPLPGVAATATPPSWQLVPTAG
jgi:hypothetical protein